MAGPAANFASFTLISREMGRKSAIIYLASIVVGAMTFGLIIDYALPADWFTLGNAQAMAGKEHAFSLLSTASSAVLVILLVVSIPNRKNLALVVLLAPPWPEYCSMVCQDFP